jgi:hypothetical protein
MRNKKAESFLKIKPKRLRKQKTERQFSKIKASNSSHHLKQTRVDMVGKKAHAKNFDQTQLILQIACLIECQYHRHQQPVELA